MSATGLDVFDTTLQKTHVWLDDMTNEMQISSRQAAYQALRACLHSLRDRLSVAEVTDLAAQMPMLVRGIFYEGWKPNASKAKDRSLESFYEEIMQNFEGRPHASPAVMARSVFAVLSKHISAGEIEDVKQALPSQIRELWPAPSETR